MRKDLKQFNYTLANKTPIDARLYLLVYHELYKELFGRFGFDALYYNGPCSDAFPDLIQVAVDEVASTEHGHLGHLEKLASWGFIETLVNNVVNGQQPQIPASYSVSSGTQIAEAIVHTLWEITTERKRPSVDLAAKLIIALALSLDIDRVIRPEPDRMYDEGLPQRRLGKMHEDVPFRLLSYMPQRAMDRMIETMDRHPLATLLASWNAREIVFAVSKT